MKWVVNLGISVAAVLAPIHSVLITVGVLTLCDLVLGIASAIKRKEPITSAGIGRTVVKLTVYELGVILGFLCEKYLMGGVLPIAKIISGLIGATELKSCLENLDSINGSPIFAAIIRKLNSTNDNINK